MFKRFAPRRALELLLLVSAAAACRDHPAGADSSPVVRIGFGIGTSAKSSGLLGLTDMLYSEALLSREWDGRVAPKLATGWSWEQNGTVLRLQLKPGVLLHDGSLLTADVAAKQMKKLLHTPGKNAGWGFQYVQDITAPN